MTARIPAFPFKVKSVGSKEAVDWFERLRVSVNTLNSTITASLPGGTVTGAAQYRSSTGTFSGDDNVLISGSGGITATSATLGSISFSGTSVSATDITMSTSGSSGLTFSNTYDSIINIASTYHATRNPYYQSFIKLNTQTNNVLISAPRNNNTQLYFNLPNENGNAGEFLSWSGSGASSMMQWSTITDYTTISTIDASNDYVLIYDASDGDHKKVSAGDLGNARHNVWMGI